MPASGGSAAPTQLTTLAVEKGELRHIYPTVVAGGRAILFTVVTGNGRGAEHIEALSLATHERHLVVPSGSSPLFAASGHLIFVRDRTLLAAPFDEERQVVTGHEVKVPGQFRLGSTILR